MPDQFIYSTDDVLRMLDALVMDRGGAWWSEFLAEHSTTCPFLVDWPDESLAEWFGAGLLTPGRVLELGCGNGRNATYLAGLGCRVDAVDFSAQAADWAHRGSWHNAVAGPASRRTGRRCLPLGARCGWSATGSAIRPVQ